jgi:hypothetical protein
MLENNQPDPWIKWEIEIQNQPQKIFCEAFEDAVIIRKQDQKLGVGMTEIELECAIAVLRWITRAGINVIEAAQAADELSDVKKGIEGK